MDLATSPMFDPALIRAWVPHGAEISSTSDAELGRLALVATQAIERCIGRTIVKRTAITELHDGYDARGDYSTWGWARGRQNIEVSAISAGIDPVPEELQHVGVELAYHLFREGAVAGQESSSMAGKSEQHLRRLSPGAQGVLDSYRAWGRPPGVAREALYLAHWPVIGTPTVKENGVALTVGTGYDASGAYDVLLYRETGKLLRTRRRVQT